MGFITKTLLWTFAIVMVVITLTSAFAESCDRNSYAKLLENQEGRNPYTIYEICQPESCYTPTLFSYTMDQSKAKGSVATSLYRIYEQEYNYYDEILKEQVNYKLPVEQKTDTLTLQNTLSLGLGKYENDCYKIKIKGEWNAEDCESQSTSGSWTTSATCSQDNVITWAGFDYSEWIEWAWESGNWPGILTNVVSDGTNLTLAKSKAHMWSESDQIGNYRFENTVTDSSGKGYDFTVVNGSAAYGTGFVGKSLDDSLGTWINITSGEEFLAWGNGTLMYWYNGTSTVSDTIFWAGLAGNYLAIYYGPGAGEKIIAKMGHGAVTTLTSTTDAQTNEWTQVAVVWGSQTDSGGMELYVNGIKEADDPYDGAWVFQGILASFKAYIGKIGNPTETYTGQIDEILFYNRSLSGASIKQLYDYQKGNYSKSGNTVLNPIQFNSAAWTNWTNVSWVETRDLVDTNITIKIEASTDNSTWTTLKENASNSYPFANLSKYLRITPALFTDNINITPFLESLTVDYEQPDLLWITETHSPGKMTETLTGSFNFNLTGNDNIADLNASFYWNSSTATFNLTTKTKSGQLFGFNVSFTIPTVTKNEDKNYWWNITKYYTNGSEAVESFMYNIEVLNTGLRNCTFGNLTSPAVLNITFWEEKNPESPVSVSVRASFNIWKASRAVNETFSFTINDTNTIRFCLSPNGTTWNSDAIIDYNGPASNLRTMYLLNQTLNATTNRTENDIALRFYDIFSSDSSGITFIVQDGGGNALAGHYVKAIKFDPGTGESYTVGMDRASFEGKAFLYLNKFDTLYQFIIQNYTKIVFIGTQFKVSTDELTLTTDPSTFNDKWKIFNSVAYTLTNDSTNIIATFTKNSASITHVCLKVSRLTMKGSPDVCDTCSTSVSGTITCSIGTENGTFIGTLYTYQSGSVIKDVAATLKLDRIFFAFQDKIGESVGLFGAFIITGTLTAIGLFWPPVAIILCVVGLVLSWGLGLLKLTYTIILSLIIVMVIILAKMR